MIWAEFKNQYFRQKRAAENIFKNPIISKKISFEEEILLLLSFLNHLKFIFKISERYYI